MAIAPMRWATVAPFIETPAERWLAPFVDATRHDLHVISRGRARSWHANIKGVTGLTEWLDYQRLARRAWKADADGVITVFPQLAVAAGLQKRLRRNRRPLVCWCLNIGRLYPGVKRSLARYALSAADCCVVHARRECDNYSAWLGLPRERFEFVPLQKGYIEPTHAENVENPFVLSMGSAHRDYQTLFDAIRPLNLRTVVVTSPRCLDGLDVPACVEVRSGLSYAECLVLAQQARLNVVPVSNDDTASGQVTVVDAMWLARPVIATRCLGTEDYIADGKDGYLVAPGDADELRRTVAMLWDDNALRARVGSVARNRATTDFSDEMAGAALTRVLDRFR